MRYIIFLLLSSSLFFTACSDDFFSQTIEVDPPDFKKSIAVHALPTFGDSILSVMLSRNFGIFEDPGQGAYFISGAVIEIFENGQSKLIRTNPPPKDAFNPIVEIPIAPDFFKVGNTYEMKVTHPDFPVASSTQVMPHLVQVDSVKVRANGTITPDGERIGAIDAYIKDQSGVKNYYAISVEGEKAFFVNSVLNPDGSITYDTFYYSNNSIYPATPDDPNSALGAFRTIVVSDEFFDGKTYRLTFPFYNYSNGSSSTYDVVVRAITEDFYIFLLSSQKKSDAEDFGIFVEPVTLHSNVKGGIGLFGLSQAQRFVIEQ